MSELEVLIKFKHGDPNAFKILYEKYFELVYYYILSRVNDRLEAEDLTEDLFLHLWEHRKTIVIKKSFKSYVLRTAHNRVINYCNSLGTKMQREQKTVDEEEIKLFSETDITDNYLLIQELREHIILAVNSLPDKCRKIFKLSRQYSYKYSQIAEKLGISINTVEKQISIALTKLRSELKDFLH